MNEFNIKVDIKNNKLIAPIIELVQNDYNSTKLKFDFTGDDNYVKVFQLQLPDGSMWIKDIIDNEILLADEKEGQIVPILVQSGMYIFDVAIYGSNKKLTTTNQESFHVRSEISGQDVELDDRLPILDALINETHNTIKEVGDIKAQADYAKEQGDYAKQEAEKVDSVVEYVTTTSTEAKEVSKTAESIAKGANQSLSFGDYATMISVFNALNNDTYKTGQNVLIITLNVPDLWVSDVLEENITYTYTTDEDLVSLLKLQGYIQVGYYKLSPLETQKVDLIDYQKKSELGEEQFAITYEDGTTKTIRSVVYK